MSKGPRRAHCSTKIENGQKYRLNLGQKAFFGHRVIFFLVCGAKREKLTAEFVYDNAVVTHC